MYLTAPSGIPDRLSGMLSPVSLTLPSPPVSSLQVNQIGSLTLPSGIPSGIPYPPSGILSPGEPDRLHH